MLHKMRQNRGLTTVELLCATAILLLLGLMLNSGLHMAMDSYRRMVLRSETDLLFSTLSDVLADELRYASNVTVLADGSVTYTSQLYGKETKLVVGTGTDADTILGQVYAETGTDSASIKRYPLLPDGAYGGKKWLYTWSYGIKPPNPSELSDPGGLVITFDSTERVFTVKLKVQERKTADESGFDGITVERTLKIRCLNK